MLNQKDSHSQMFANISTQLFKGTNYPSVHWPTKKPKGIRTIEMEGKDRPVRVMTYRGILVFGIT